MTYFLYTDGGSRGNPGPSAIGVIIKNEEQNVFELGKYLGSGTNNEAEYEAIVHGLNAAISRNIKNIICHLDSELVVKQLNGLYKVKNENLKKYYDVCKKLVEKFDSVKFVHIRREKNAEADGLVNKTLDAHV